MCVWGWLTNLIISRYELAVFVGRLQASRVSEKVSALLEPALLMRALLATLGSYMSLHHWLESIDPYQDPRAHSPATSGHPVLRTFCKW